MFFSNSKANCLKILLVTQVALRLQKDMYVCVKNRIGSYYCNCAIDDGYVSNGTLLLLLIELIHFCNLIRPLEGCGINYSYYTIQ